MGVNFKFAGMSAAKANRIRKEFFPLLKREEYDAVKADVNDAFMTKCIKHYINSKVFHTEQDKNSKDFSNNYTDPV